MPAPKALWYSRRAALQTAATAVCGLLGIDALLSARPATAAQALPPEASTDMIKQGFKVAAGDTRADQHFHMKGVTANTLDVKVSGADSGGRLAMLEQIGQSPNGGPPRHLHADQDEFFYALEGRYRFEVGDQSFELGAGDSIFAPRGVPFAAHGMTVVGPPLSPE